MTDLAPGQTVICVDGGFGERERRLISSFPINGAVYTVRGVWLEGGRGPGVWLAEIVNPPINVIFATGVVRQIEPSFMVSRFRPANDSAIDVFRAMLEPKRRHEYV